MSEPHPKPAEGNEPSRQQFLEDVLGGLARSPKSLPCKYFYDLRGSELFEQICALDEYYLTRTELQIMQTHAGEMASQLGRECVLVEPGSGSGLKTRLLLDRLEASKGWGPAAFVPIDISGDHLAEAAAELDRRYPNLAVHPVCADFAEPFALPESIPRGKPTSVYFPGSTIGNFGPQAAVTLLRRIAGLISGGGGLLIGFDLHKDPEMLEAAYNDAAGVTAEFNRNLLVRINRELDGDFHPEQFRHHAFFNAEESRVEMHLVSRRDQTARVAGREFRFREGETIHTENSYKYSMAQFGEIARQAGLGARQSWFDRQRLFCVQFLTPE